MHKPEVSFAFAAPLESFDSRQRLTTAVSTYTQQVRSWPICKQKRGKVNVTHPPRPFWLDSSDSTNIPFEVNIFLQPIYSWTLKFDAAIWKCEPTFCAIYIPINNKIRENMNCHIYSVLQINQFKELSKKATSQKKLRKDALYKKRAYETIFRCACNSFSFKMQWEWYMLHKTNKRKDYEL